MSPGKLAAQVAHCAEAYWTQMIRNYDYYDGEMYESDVVIDKDVFEQYIQGSFIKTICEAKNKNHLLRAKELAEAKGLIENVDYGIIYDKCYTELVPEELDGTTITGIWFRPLPDDVSRDISKKYQLYR